MARSRASVPNKLQPWIEARKRFHLSHAHIQMARALGLNPKKLGGLDNHRQELWKQPLPEFIARLYQKRFGVCTPPVVRSIEEMVAATKLKKQQRKARRESATADPPPDDGVAHCVTATTKSAGGDMPAAGETSGSP